MGNRLVFLLYVETASKGAGEIPGPLGVPSQPYEDKGARPLWLNAAEPAC